MLFQENISGIQKSTVPHIYNLIILILFLALPILGCADCNHAVVDRDSRFACVTVINKYHKTLAVTGSPGFSLNPGSSEETFLLTGSSDSVQITPNPYSPYENEKQLACLFYVSQARERQITITYDNESYEVNPIEFKNNCVFKKPTG